MLTHWRTKARWKIGNVLMKLSCNKDGTSSTVLETSDDPPGTTLLKYIYFVSLSVNKSEFKIFIWPIKII